MRKRRQHHVWQRYLKSWEVDGRIYCLRDGHIFSGDTTNIAVERDFYKLHELNKNDIALIRMLAIDINGIHPSAKATHESFLELLNRPVRMVERYRRTFHDTKRMDEFIDTYRTNALEDHHAAIENSFEPLLRKILEGDLGFYERDDECIDFLHFISAQYMRTKGIKVKTIANVRNGSGIDVTRIWGILSHMFSVNIGAALFSERKRRRLLLVRNPTIVPFVTGDQPVINLHATTPLPPTQLSFYYPISPTLALILSESDEEPVYSSGSLSPIQASQLNGQMLESSHSQVFGNSKEVLASLLSPLGDDAA